MSDRTFPDAPPARGDLRSAVANDGPAAYAWPPTSGNAWSRAFLDSVLPIPEQPYRTCPDLYLLAFAPIFGPIEALSEPHSFWRVHGQNNSRRITFDDWLRTELERWHDCARRLANYCDRLGVIVDYRQWQDKAWVPRINLAAGEIRRLIPENAAIVFADGESWGAGREISGLRRIPFLEHNGEFWDCPPILRRRFLELHCQRQGGATFFAIEWSVFWWLDQCPEFVRYLESRFRCMVRDERIIIFDLRGD